MGKTLTSSWKFPAFDWSSTHHRGGDLILFSLGLVVLFGALGCIGIACILLLSTRFHARKEHVVQGKRIYSDLSEEGKPLFSPRMQLSGCPDYIVRSNNQIIPVEVKSCTADRPYKSHIFQLACYCQLVEDTYHQFVSKGILIYTNDRYQIPYDPQLRFELEKTLREMRQLLRSGRTPSFQQDQNRCQHCSLKTYCSLYQKN